MENMPIVTREIKFVGIERKSFTFARPKTI